MKRIKFSLFLLSLFSALLIASAFEPGFYSIDSKKVPEKVREKSDAVFRLVNILHPPLMLSLKEYESNVEKIKNLKGFDADEVRRVGKQCREMKADFCPSYYNKLGSAFLVENKKTIVTVPHVFPKIMKLISKLSRKVLADYLLEVEKLEKEGVENKFEKTNELEEKLNRQIIEINEKIFIKLREESDFLLIDSKGNTVFDTRKPMDQFSLIGFVSPAFFAVTQRFTLVKHLVSNHEILVLRLNREIDIEPFNFAPIRSVREQNNLVPIGEPLYVLGYPGSASTDRFKLYQAPDADGSSLVVSIGKRKESKEFAMAPFEKLFKKIDHKMLNAINNFTDRYLFLTTADGFEGMSGGPIVNSEGQVVSVLNSTVGISLLNGKPNPYYPGALGIAPVDLHFFKQKIDLMQKIHSN